jgi:hypothetical protein
VAKFSARAFKASQQQESVDDGVLEISETVAAHWTASLPYFVAAGTAGMTQAFIAAGMVVTSQTSS